jgi:Ca-activated chloride channel family protein
VGEIIDEIDLHGKNRELVNELVALATRHGILTPYTSFLADETANIRDLASNQTRANSQLEALQLESGSIAFYHRRMKNSLQRVSQAPTSGFGIAADAAGLGGMNRGRQAGMMGGSSAGMPAMMSGRGGAHGVSAPTGTMMYEVMSAMGMPAGYEENDGPLVVPTVLNVGKKTFFRRNDRWEDSTLTDSLLENVKKIQRYGKEYFDLTVRFGKDVAKYLAIEGNVIVVLDNVAYEF